MHYYNYLNGHLCGDPSQSCTTQATSINLAQKRYTCRTPLHLGVEQLPLGPKGLTWSKFGRSYWVKYGQLKCQIWNLGRRCSFKPLLYPWKAPLISGVWEGVHGSLFSFGTEHSRFSWHLIVRGLGLTFKKAFSSNSCRICFKGQLLSPLLR